MKIQLQLEGLALLIISLLGFSYFVDGSWWVFGVLFLTPDIGMLGYVISPKLGAITYNIFHHLLSALLVGFAGYYFEIHAILFYGFVMAAHIGFDRMLGYGLKYPEAFKSTHLDKL